MLASGLKNAPYERHQWVWRQLHQSRMDILLPSRIASPTFGHFLGRHVWIGTVDNRHSRLQTGGRYSFPWRALSCIVALVLVFLGAVHMLALVAVFVSIAREVDFVHLYWRVECDCCRLQAMRHKIGMLLISFSMCTNDTAGNIIWHILWCR